MSRVRFANGFRAVDASDVNRWRSAWGLDLRVDFLNHGAFGACPLEVLATQQQLRDEMESQPVAFLHRELEPRLDASREALAEFLSADANGIAFVQNATSGVNTVLRSLEFERGGSILVTNHGYNACRNAVHFVADRWGLSIQVARVPCPVTEPQQIVDAILEAADESTTLAVIDHVTSPTAIVFPIEKIVEELHSRGVRVLVDGAHAPGMIPLNLTALGADFYTGNCHKWMCAPKGAAFLYVAPQHRDRLKPLIVSHGANSDRTDRTRLQLEFDWVGTVDPTPWICVESALHFLRRYPGGVHAVMRENHEKAKIARDILSDRVGLQCTVSKDESFGSIVAFVLPEGSFAGLDTDSHDDPLGLDPLHAYLHETCRIEVPVFQWRDPHARLLRISAQLYNTVSQYERLADELLKVSNISAPS